MHEEDSMIYENIEYIYIYIHNKTYSHLSSSNDALPACTNIGVSLCGCVSLSVQNQMDEQNNVGGGTLFAPFHFSSTHAPPCLCA